MFVRMKMGVAPAHGVGADDGAWRTGIALGLPDRPGKIKIVMPARNDVPVQCGVRLPRLARFILSGAKSERTTFSTAKTTFIKEVRSPGSRSLISRMWAVHTTRQNPG
jgi:hypothetical protein